MPDSLRLGAQDPWGARTCPCPWAMGGDREHEEFWLALRCPRFTPCCKTRLHGAPDPQPKAMERVPVTLGEGVSLRLWSALTPGRDQTRASLPADTQLGVLAGAESPCSPARRPGLSPRRGPQRPLSPLRPRCTLQTCSGCWDSPRCPWQAHPVFSRRGSISWEAKGALTPQPPPSGPEPEEGTEGSCSTSAPARGDLTTPGSTLPQAPCEAGYLPRKKNNRFSLLLGHRWMAP